MIVSTDLERKIKLIIFIDQQRPLNASKTFPNLGYLLVTVISIVLSSLIGVFVSMGRNFEYSLFISLQFKIMLYLHLNRII